MPALDDSFWDTIFHGADECKSDLDKKTQNQADSSGLPSTMTLEERSQLEEHSTTAIWSGLWGEPEPENAGYVQTPTPDNPKIEDEEMYKEDDSSLSDASNTEALKDIGYILIRILKMVTTCHMIG